MNLLLKIKRAAQSGKALTLTPQDVSELWEYQYVRELADLALEDARERRREQTRVAQRKHRLAVD